MEYLQLDDFYALMPHGNELKKLVADYSEKIAAAPGSSHNHQAWAGGFIDHTTETLNIAWWLYRTSPRPFPFELPHALEVMFLHDIEKPFSADLKLAGKYSKPDRRAFRAAVITDRKINLTPEQWNALRYVEGVPDSEYTPGERTMGELAAFCHCCDILSARLWHDKGRMGSWDE